MIIINVLRRERDRERNNAIKKKLEHILKFADPSWGCRGKERLIELYNA